jgi:hypothetical protein
MASGVTVNKTRFRLPSEIKLTTKELMTEIGLLAREMIVRRTAAGKDADGQSFQPYSAAYAKRKAEELGTSQVNLQVSGRMLNALTIVEVTETSVTLGFSD